MTSPKTRRKQKVLTVYLFNVGQGDHLLLKLPDGTFGVIDFYYEAKMNAPPEPPALTYLKQLHQPKSPVSISFICLSHADRDHTKGVDKFLAWVTEQDIHVERLWLYPGIDKIAIDAAIQKTKSQYICLRNDLRAIGEFIKGWKGTPAFLEGIRHLDNLKGPIEVCVMAPLGIHIQKANYKTLASILAWNKKDESPALPAGNLVSSVIKMGFYKHQLLFGGDTSEKVWQECLDEFDRRHRNKQGPCHPTYKANFIKVSHHGSKYSSSAKLWERILGQKALAAISAGQGKDSTEQGKIHPHRETITHILMAAKKIKASAQIITTNTCSRCLTDHPPTTESFEWYPKARVITRKRVKEALDDVGPGHNKDGTPYQTGNPLIRDALDSVISDHDVKKSLPTNMALVAYIFQFYSNRKDIRISVSRKPSANEPDCIFKYAGDQKFFPECK